MNQNNISAAELFLRVRELLILTKMKQKTRNKFDVAIAEDGTEDSLTLLRLAVVSISNSERHLRSKMDKCELMMEAVAKEEVTDSHLEIYALD